MAEHYRVQLGQAIKRRRQELGLTQKELAEATHYKEAQTVSRWERGENMPSNLDVVAQALELSLGDLVAGIDAPDRKTARQLGIADGQTPDLNGTLTAVSQIDRLEDQVRTLTEKIELLTQQVEGMRLKIAGNVLEVLRRLDAIQPQQPAARRRRRA